MVTMFPFLFGEVIDTQRKNRIEAEVGCFGFRCRVDLNGKAVDAIAQKFKRQVGIIFADVSDVQVMVRFLPQLLSFLRVLDPSRHGFGNTTHDRIGIRFPIIRACGHDGYIAHAAIVLVSVEAEDGHC